MRFLFKLLKKIFGLTKVRVIQVDDTYGNRVWKVQRKYFNKDPKAKTIWEWRDEPDPLKNNATVFNDPDQALQWYYRIKSYPKKNKIKVLDEH